VDSAGQPPRRTQDRLRPGAVADPAVGSRGLPAGTAADLRQRWADQAVVVPLARAPPASRGPRCRQPRRIAHASTAYQPRVRPPGPNTASVRAVRARTETEMISADTGIRVPPRGTTRSCGMWSCAGTPITKVIT
jgi:hypothetical protein